MTVRQHIKGAIEQLERERGIREAFPMTMKLLGVLEDVEREQPRETKQTVVSIRRQNEK